MRRGRAFVGGLLVTLTVTGLSVSGRTPDDVAQASRDIGMALDDGRFADAETQARSLFISLGGSVDERQPDATRAADLLLDALVANGRGGDPESQDLAQEILRRRLMTSPPDQRLLASARPLLARGAALLGAPSVANGLFSETKFSD